MNHIRLRGSEREMVQTSRNQRQAWSWAIIVNLIVFGVLWVMLLRMPEPIRATTEPSGRPGEPGSTETSPGGAFGQMTHLMGEGSTAEGEGLGVSSEQPQVPVNQPETPLPPAEPAEAGETAPSRGTGQWVDEFYLDQGPALSFAPRLNPDGTPRGHPQKPDRVKAPTYEDFDTNLDVSMFNLPEMTPNEFSKYDLPEELRDFNFDLAVRINLDRRGRVQGRPQIVRSSGSRLVDQATIDKIINDARFTPATRKGTGEPVPCTLNWPIFWAEIAPVKE